MQVENGKVSRRDFLANLSIVGAGLAMGLSPRISLGKSNPQGIAPKGAKIARLAIYPSIGICRIGNSGEYFLGPEIPGVIIEPKGGYKDGVNKVKKQAQRFRIYAFDEEGRVIREINAKQDKITWTVQVANTKAAWYEFNNPLDMGTYVPAIAGRLRNSFFLGKDRKALEIISDVVSIDGINRNALGNLPDKQMVGTFWPKPFTQKVKLGDLRTDAAGRLVVVPGDGIGNAIQSQNPINNFADNDGWYDDWCDGYVKATVKIDGLSNDIKVEPAWVACCGPDFSPEITPFISMYDVVRDVMVNGKEKPLVQVPLKQLSFRQEIYPFFERLGMMAWTTSAANYQEGWIKLGNFLNPDYINQLADPSSQNLIFRQEVLAKFRNPKDYKFYHNEGDYDEKIKYKIPYMLGSGVNHSYSPGHWFTMPKLQYDILVAWANGDFINDLNDLTKADKTLLFEDIPLDQQPDALIRAALEPVSGGAFHPGVELTWPLRQQELYRNDLPFRIRVDEHPEPNYKQAEKMGLMLTPQAVFGDAQQGNLSGESYSYTGTFPEGSPIGPQKPGDLTRWLGLPWFPDAFSCQDVTYSNDFPNAAWWPSNLPIDVLPEFAYLQLSRNDLPDNDKLKYFYSRVRWSRGVAGVGYHANASYFDGLSRMVALWPKMGFVVKRKRPENLSETLKKLLPEYMFVEVDRGNADILAGGSPKTGLED